MGKWEGRRVGVGEGRWEMEGRGEGADGEGGWE